MVNSTIILSFYGLLTFILLALLLYVFINRINQKDDFEDRDN